jgi:hypothetical protein
MSEFKVGDRVYARPDFSTRYGGLYGQVTCVMDDGFVEVKFLGVFTPAQLDYDYTPYPAPTKSDVIKPPKGKKSKKKVS